MTLQSPISEDPALTRSSQKPYILTHQKLAISVIHFPKFHSDFNFLVPLINGKQIGGFLNYYLKTAVSLILFVT